MNEGSRTAAGVLNDSETSQSTGIRASATTTKLAVPQKDFWATVVPWPPPFRRRLVVTPAVWPGVVVTVATSGSPLPDVGAGGRGAEALDERERDDRDADEDEDRDRGPDPQVQGIEQVVVAQERDRPGVVGPGGQDEDVVEDPEGVQRPEQQRDQDGRLHQRQGNAREALPAGGTVDLRGLLQVLRDQGEPGEQQQRYERRGLPDLRQDDHDDGGELVRQRRGRHRGAAEQRGQVALARRPGVLPAVGGSHRHYPVGDERGGPHR